MPKCQQRRFIGNSASMCCSIDVHVVGSVNIRVRGYCQRPVCVCAGVSVPIILSSSAMSRSVSIVQYECFVRAVIVLVLVYVSECLCVWVFGGASAST